VIRLRLPALRERREDVPMLTRFFLQQSAKQLGVEPKRISDAALKLLGSFDFPGNVRQLENVCHWLTVMAPAQVIETKDLPPEVLGAVGHAEMLSAASTGLPAALAPAAAPPATFTSPMAAVESVREAVTPAPAPVAALPAAVAADAPAATSSWEAGLQAEAMALLETGRTDVWDVLTRRFETRLIQTALTNTRGRRIEAAHKLGIGRNTITRKIQELGME
jgi:two-component system nitrogen regulation response regulator GlnG